MLNPLAIRAALALTTTAAAAITAVVVKKREERRHRRNDVSPDLGDSLAARIKRGEGTILGGVFTPYDPEEGVGYEEPTVAHYCVIATWDALERVPTLAELKLRTHFTTRRSGERKDRMMVWQSERVAAKKAEEARINNPAHHYYVMEIGPTGKILPVFYFEPLASRPNLKEPGEDDDENLYAMRTV